MKLVSSIIALAVFGQIVPALAVCALCTLSCKILFLIFWFIQNLCCPPSLDGDYLLVGTIIGGGGINCIYGNDLVTTGKCYYVSIQVCLLGANVLPLDRTRVESAIIGVNRRVLKASFARYQICSASTENKNPTYIDFRVLCGKLATGLIWRPRILTPSVARKATWIISWNFGCWSAWVGCE